MDEDDDSVIVSFALSKKCKGVTIPTLFVLLPRQEQQNFVQETRPCCCFLYIVAIGGAG